MSTLDITALDAQVTQGLQSIEACTTLEAIEALHAQLLGKKGSISGSRRLLGTVPGDQRKDAGAAINTFIERLTEAYDAKREVLQREHDAIQLASEVIDITLPPRIPPRGSLHPLHETMEDILEVFIGLGYEVIRGVEVESEWFNFDALNAPEDHPARALSDTIYVHGINEGEDTTREDGTTPMLLRPQTSPMQIRTMMERTPPYSVVIPGRVYRMDTADATHVPVFHQIEGLSIGKNISMRDLYGTLMAYAKGISKTDTKVRFRPHYFPFTEPSAELDAWIPDPKHPEGGKWVELLGAGMVHPNVLRNGGVDPEEWQGFAFGLGIERAAMVRYGVPDLRLFVDNDLRLLRSFQ